MLKNLLLSCLALLATVTQADTLTLSQGGVQVALAPYLTYIEDRDQAYTLEQVQTWDLHWQQNHEVSFSQPYNHSAWWLRVDIQNSSSTAFQRLLEVNYAALDSVTVYQLKQGEVVTAYEMGDLLPYAERPINHRLYLTPLTFDANSEYTVYIRVASEGALQVPLTLWEPDAFSSLDSTRNLLYGVFFGIMVVFAIFNLLIYSALRESPYILYVGYNLSLVVFMATLGGFLYRYVWPEAVELNQRMTLYALAAAITMGILFSRAFLRIGEHMPKADRILQILAIVGVLLGVIATKAPFQYAVMGMSVVGCACAVLCLFIAINCWRKGIANAHYYVLGWGTMLFSAFIMALTKFHVISDAPILHDVVYIGVAIEAILLSFGLTDRIRLERDLRVAANQTALLAEQRSKVDMEAEIERQTRELRAQKDEIEKLSKTDQLTGLNNRRAFDETLEKEWKRNLSFKRDLALIILDIDHFKSVNDTYGHPAGDQCLKIVAKQIADNLRSPADVACRYGGEEFCVILPETNVEAALALAERLRQTIERTPINTTEGPLSITISLGINACIPTGGLSTQRLLQEADEALYQAKQQGRNRAMVAAGARNSGGRRPPTAQQGMA